MRRFAQVTQLLPEQEAAYVQYHQQVWPQVLQTIANCHIANYSIFLRNGILFAYFEYYGDDYDADQRKMAACPVTQRWWSIMDPMQLPMDDARPGGKWSQMQEVFHFEPKSS